MSQPMISAQGLTREFDGRLAVEDLNLEIAEGELLGLLGPNGAGKTTTVRMLTGLIAPTRGRAIVGGHDAASEGNVVRSLVGILTETPGLYEKLSARRNLDFFGRLYGLPDDRLAAQIERTLRMLDLWDRRDEPVGGFSRGMKQKLAIARAVLHEPPVLFLDEPTSGLDPESAHNVRDFIAGLKREGRTVVLCTHNLGEAERLSDRVGIISRRLVELDTPARLRARLSGHQVAVSLRVTTAAMVGAIRALGFVRDVQASDSSLVVSVDDPATNTPDLVRALVGAGADVISLGEVRASLEDVYLNLVHESSASQPRKGAPAGESI